MQNAVLGFATEYTKDTKIQHLHDETQTFPVTEHFKLHASNQAKRTTSCHPLHNLTKHNCSCTQH